MTPLDKSLKRSLNIQGLDYVVSLTPETLKLTRKGRRLGLELKWSDLISGETALAVALHASIGQFDAGGKDSRRPVEPKEVSADRPPAAKSRRSKRASPKVRTR